MSSRFLEYLLIAALGSVSCSAAERVLRVCSDPDHLPYSNRASEGFENRIAEILASDLHARVEYSWWAPRKSLVETTLNAQRCDLLIGVPSALEGALTTAPYYESSYVFVARQDRHLALSSLNDPRLDQWKIGVHIVGDNYAPPAYVLARRGLTANLVGFSLFGGLDEKNPQEKLLAAVERGEVDAALAWGPLAGYFAKRSGVLETRMVSPSTFLNVPFTYGISAAVRSTDQQLRTEIEAALRRECMAIRTVLNDYGVPQIQEGKQQCEGSQSPRSALLH